jgi:hypothetical protein
MALTSVTRVGRATTSGHHRAGFFDIVGPASYTTSGETLSLTSVGLTSYISQVLVSQANGLIVEPVYATDGSCKLKFLHPTGGATAAAAAANAPTATGTQGAVTQPTISTPTASGGSATVPAGATPVTSTGANPATTFVQPTISTPVATGGAVAAPTVALKAGVGKEVGSTIDLSALTWRIKVEGT